MYNNTRKNGKQAFDENIKAGEFNIPKVKVNYDKKVIYYNSSALPIINCLVEQIGSDLVFKNFPEIFDLKAKSYYDINVRYNNSLLHFFVLPFPEAGYIGLYGDFVVHETGRIIK